MAEIKEDKVVIDTRGQVCPLPVLRTKKGLERISTGQMLEVIASDHGSASDIPALVKSLGHQLVEVKQSDGLFHFFILKR